MALTYASSRAVLNSHACLGSCTSSARHACTRVACPRPPLGAQLPKHSNDLPPLLIRRSRILVVPIPPRMGTIWMVVDRWSWNWVDKSERRTAVGLTCHKRGIFCTRNRRNSSTGNGAIMSVTCTLWNLVEMATKETQISNSGSQGM